MATASTPRPRPPATDRGFAPRTPRQPPPGFFKLQLGVSLALAAAILAGFCAINSRSIELLRSGQPLWIPALALDAAIPFAPAWVWAYCLYYPLSFAPLLLRAVREDLALFWRVVGAYLFQFSAAFLIFWFFPSEVLRPAVAGTGLCARAVALLYRLDPGGNAFPSMHVCGVVYTSCVFARYRGGVPGLAVAILSALVVASTLLIKQHFLLDAAGGAALAAVTFFLFHAELGRSVAPSAKLKLLQSRE